MKKVYRNKVEGIPGEKKKSRVGRREIGCVGEKCVSMECVDLSCDKGAWKRFSLVLQTALQMCEQTGRQIICGQISVI